MHVQSNFTEQYVDFLMENVGGSEKSRLLMTESSQLHVYLELALCDFLGSRTAWMLGRTPP